MINCQNSSWDQFVQTNFKGLEQQWLSDGYARRHQVTPTLADVGTSSDAWLKGPWALNGPVFVDINNSIDIALAPDGTPALRTTLQPGVTTAANYRGLQLGHGNTDNSVVYSHRVWLDWASDLGQNYIGAGHYWGSQQNVNFMPSGGNHRSDSWSVRGIAGLNNRLLSAYYYKSDGTTPFGQSVSGSTLVSSILGRWVTMETQIIQNNPHTASNGIIRIFIDGVMVAEVTNLQLRNDADTFPKGMSFFVSHNNGAQQTEVNYYKDWCIYTLA